MEAVEVRHSGTAYSATRSFARLRKLLGHEWIAAGGLLVLDLAAWVLIYTFVVSARGDAFYASELQLVFVEAVQLFVIAMSLFVVGGYNRHTEWRGLSYTTEHVFGLAGAAAMSALLIYSAATFDQTMKPSRGALLVSFVIFGPLSLGYRRAIRNRLQASTATRAFLVVGSGELALLFYLAYKKSSVNPQRLEFVDIEHRMVGKHIAGPGSPIIEGDLATKLDRLDQSYSGVILAERVDRLRPELLERLVRIQFLKVRVYTLESFHEAHWRYVPLQSLDPFWPLQTGFQLARNSPFHYLKKAFDVGLSAVLLVICFPLMVIIGFLIWLESGQPVVFRQTRVGRDNMPFTAYKFRTMRAKPEASRLFVNGSELMGAEGTGGQKRHVGNQKLNISNQDAKAVSLNHERITNNSSSELTSEDDIYTRRDDPRVTRVGRWLRKLRLDELPQLWNVLNGEMSLIGPRAEWTKCAERYEKIIPFYHFRHMVKPGITGWAQVNYPYGESDADAIEKLKYDLYYIRNYSLKLDLMIVLKTVYTVLFGKGQ